MTGRSHTRAQRQEGGRGHQKHEGCQLLHHEDPAGGAACLQVPQRRSQGSAGARPLPDGQRCSPAGVFTPLERPGTLLAQQQEAQQLPIWRIKVTCAGTASLLAGAETAQTPG